MSSNLDKTINFYANDPSASEVPLKKAKYSIYSGPQKWQVDGDSQNINLFNPGTLDFQRSELNLALSRCIELWNEAYEGAFDSWSSTESLKIFPQVDYKTVQGFNDGFNAFYDGQNLVFLYDKNIKTNETVFTSESLEVIAHEAGHGILDSIHPEFNNLLLPEVRAFHEAYGDCSAILTTLRDEDVRKAFLKVSDPLIESNCVSKLAEEFGEGTFSVGGRNRSPGDCLRNAINDFKYQNPSTLPIRGPDTTLTRGGHSFSRVFTGGFYGSLVRMFNIISQEISDKEQALIKARSDMEKILAGAVLSTFATPTLFREIALGMLKVDNQLFNGKYKESIIEAFVEKKILSSISGNSISTDMKLQSTSGDAKSIDEIKVPENINEIKGQKFKEEVSQFLGLSDKENLTINVKNGLRDNFIIVKGTQQEWINLKTNKNNLPDEVKIYLPSGFDFVMDTKTKSMFSHTHVTNTKTIEEAKEDLNYLIESDKIYIPKTNEKIDTWKLAGLHKPYYLDEDNKIIRAYFA